MLNIINLIVFFPIIIDFFKEFPVLQKNFKYRVIKGYIFLVGLPLIFIYISSNAINAMFSSLPNINLIFTIHVLFAYITSNKLFYYRLKREKIDFGTERWFMTRFYRDLFYALILALPALGYFFLLHPIY